MASVLDDVRENLAGMALDEKWAVVQLGLVFNSAIGGAFFLGTLFVNPVFGSGASFQAVLTGLIHLAYTLWLLHMVKARDLKHPGFVDGVSLMMNVLLIQTAILWSGLSGGLQVGICRVEGGTADRFTSVLAFVLSLSHLALSGLMFLWRFDFAGLDADSVASFKQRHAVATNFDPEAGNNSGGLHHGGYHETRTQHVSPGNADSSHFVIDDDLDAEL